MLFVTTCETIRDHLDIHHCWRIEQDNGLDHSDTRQKMWNGHWKQYGGRRDFKVVLDFYRINTGLPEFLTQASMSYSTSEDRKTPCSNRSTSADPSPLDWIALHFQNLRFSPVALYLSLLSQLWPDKFQTMPMSSVNIGSQPLMIHKNITPHSGSCSLL